MTRLALAVLLLSGCTGPASRSAAHVIPAAMPSLAAGVDEPDLARPSRASVLPPLPSPSRPFARAAARGHHLRGVASFGYGWVGVVTRLPRGTRICVTGPLGRWCGRSVGYGPAKWTHRIADLSPAVFSRICGPLSAGLCGVVLSW
jgi:hypothetical protein